MDKEKKEKCLLSVRIPCDLHKKLKQMALNEDMTIQDMVVEIIKKFGKDNGTSYSKSKREI